jgi:hypothetical protein
MEEVQKVLFGVFAVSAAWTAAQRGSFLPAENFNSVT